MKYMAVALPIYFSVTNTHTHIHTRLGLVKEAALSSVSFFYIMYIDVIP